MFHPMGEVSKGLRVTNLVRTLPRCLMSGSRTNVERNNMLGKLLGVSQQDQ